ncbi:hypothetical protein SAMN04488505_102229 [Chitinophaga rupis]|uniref:Uncharacterized protein n=1 Tax=Chitinophaga rupis TaxID=573321 RepID=A0A1H7Q296_9BACT|nr:hypothetical protein SAMN04488505_102229 [Chitinophaga rupis]
MESMTANVPTDTNHASEITAVRIDGLGLTTIE